MQAANPHDGGAAPHFLQHSDSRAPPAVSQQQDILSLLSHNLTTVVSTIRYDVSEYNSYHRVYHRYTFCWNLTQIVSLADSIRLERAKMKDGFFERGNITLHAAVWNHFDQRAAQTAAPAIQTTGLSANLVHKHLHKLAASTLRLFSIHNQFTKYF